MSKVTRRTVLGIGLGAACAGAAVSFGIGQDRFLGEELTPQEAHAAALRGTITLVDIRRPDEWRKTGLGEGALGIDMRREDFVDVLLEAVSGKTDAPIALICARGVRSDRMSARLAEAGFTRIIDVPEGMLGSGAGPGWLGRSLPVVQP